MLEWRAYLDRQVLKVGEGFLDHGLHLLHRLMSYLSHVVRLLLEHGRLHHLRHELFLHLLLHRHLRLFRHALGQMMRDHFRYGLEVQ